MTDAPNCYMNWVNSGSAGTYDGVTMVAGHEYAEPITDPFLDAWLDQYGAENGDKCNVYGTNLALSTGTFPVQATWSDWHRYYKGYGCVYTMQTEPPPRSGPTRSGPDLARRMSRQTDAGRA